VYQVVFVTSFIDKKYKAFNYYYRNYIIYNFVVNCSFVFYYLLYIKEKHNVCHDLNITRVLLLIIIKIKIHDLS